MAYQQVVCPTCGDTVEAQTQRTTPDLLVGLHTRGGYLCDGVGANVNTEPCPVCGTLAAAGQIH